MNTGPISQAHWAFDGPAVQVDESVSHVTAQRSTLAGIKGMKVLDVREMICILIDRAGPDC